MERQKDEAIALVARTRNRGPITQFLETWAVAVEIARIPSTAAGLRAAEHTVQTLDQGDPVWRGAMDELRNLHSSARKSVTRY
jgi:hypothetical protein